MPRVRTTTTTITTETIDEPDASAAPQQTYVTFLLDRTGSMQTIKAATIDGFNAYLDTLQETAGDLVKFSLLTFDSISIDKVCVGAPLCEVARLTNETFIPRASTPLIDASIEAIKATERLVKDIKPAPRVVVAIQTDGGENASHRYTNRDLADLVKRHTLAGWEFVFLGANIDAYGAAAQMGISVANTMSYRGTRSQQMFVASASNMGSFASGKSRNASYSMAQKRSAGDYNGGINPSPPLGSDSLGHSGPLSQTPLTPKAPLDGTAPLVDEVDLTTPS